jgi:hypothetical protein
MVGPSQKNSFWALEKWKMIFSSKENENFLSQHCLPSQYAPLWTIWGHLNKLYHECYHNIDHLAWKPLILTYDSSFLRTLFLNNYRISSLLFLLVTWPHIMMQCEGFPIFWFFLNFLCPFQNALKTAGMTVPSLWLNLGKLLMFLWLNRYLCT